MQSLRLAYHPEGDRTLKDLRLAYNPGPIDAYGAPALLVSYVYLEPFLKNRTRYHYRDWVMDSGAFSAHASGRAVDLQAYIDTCKRLMESDPFPQSPAITSDRLRTY